MTDDAFKEAEKRGYGKGYRAGRRRAARELSWEERQEKRNAFWREAFLAALPSAIEVQGWTSGGKPVTNLKERTKLARDFANEALDVALFNGKIS